MTRTGEVVLPRFNLLVPTGVFVCVCVCVCVCVWSDREWIIATPPLACLPGQASQRDNLDAQGKQAE